VAFNLVSRVMASSYHRRIRPNAAYSGRHSDEVSGCVADCVAGVEVDSSSVQTLFIISNYLFNLCAQTKILEGRTNISEHVFEALFNVF